MEGTTRTSRKVKVEELVGRMDVPRQEIGKEWPLPTVMEEWEVGRRERSIPSVDDMWEEASESITQPWFGSAI